MKKLITALLATTAIFCTACGNQSTATNEGAPLVTTSTSQTKTQEENRIMEHLTIEANGKTFQADIKRNALTEAFLQKMPRTLSMVQLRDTSVIYGDSPISVPNNLQRGLKKGDLAYCQYGYFIIFTDDQKPDHTTGFIKIGHITSDNLDDLQAIAHGADVHFTIAK